MKKIVATVDGKTEEYDVILEFTSNENQKQYIIYGNKDKKEIRVSYYKKEDDTYTLLPIKDESEVAMCMSMVEEILNYN